MLDATTAPRSPLLAGKRIAFVGKLGGMTRREASTLVRQHGGLPVERAEEGVDWLVLGADQLPLQALESLDEATRLAAEAGKLAILSETEFWERLGKLEADQVSRRLYTPAMLAELLRVPLATVRRWHRRGLIVPVQEVQRLPYFDFQEVATARQLANLLASGMSPSAIEKKLSALSRFMRGVDRSLRQLAIIVEGRQVLLRHGEGLVEPNGQRRFDFDALEEELAPATGLDSETGSTISFSECLARPAAGATREDILRIAGAHEECGQLSMAAEMCRVALAVGGPNADVCFQLAELLYRLGDTAAARERYYMAVELNEDFVEARASLGCVLAELGELELAVAAFQGALLHHPHYADVHYHLARTLGELGRDREAREHWQTFLTLTPDSPWADEARSWLGTGAPS